MRNFPGEQVVDTLSELHPSRWSRWHRRNELATRPADTSPCIEPEAGGNQELWPTLFRLWLDRNQRWRVEPSQPQGPTGVFAELPDAVAFAKCSCSGAPATVELRMDGLYAVVHQERGWPKPICGKRAA
jgi:hypothetical protein